LRMYGGGRNGGGLTPALAGVAPPARFVRVEGSHAERSVAFPP
jgi:hypothetical protein